MKQFKKDLPLLLNGFFVGLLTYGRDFSMYEVSLFILSGITIVWYGNNLKK